MSHTTTSTPINELLLRIEAALAAHDAAVPSDEDEHDELSAALQDLAAVLTEDGAADEPVYLATVEALLATAPGAVTLVAGDQTDVRRLATAVFGVQETALIPTQIAKARRWLAALDQREARDG